MQEVRIFWGQAIKNQEIVASISFHAVESAFRFEHGWFQSFEMTFSEDKS